MHRYIVILIQNMRQSSLTVHAASSKEAKAKALANSPNGTHVLTVTRAKE